MKRLFRALFMVVGLMFSAMSFAVTTTIIDFEEFDTSSTSVTEPIVSKGFILDPAVSGVPPAIAVLNDAPNQQMIFCGWCTDGVEGISISSQSGVSFELDSLEANTNGDIFTGQVIGYLEAGGTISQSISTIGLINFDQTWVGLTSIDVLFNLTSGPVTFMVPGIDNITLQAVPVPGALWLFGSALAGLGWLRRRQRA